MAETKETAKKTVKKVVKKAPAKKAPAKKAPAKRSSSTTRVSKAASTAKAAPKKKAVAKKVVKKVAKPAVEKKVEAKTEVKVETPEVETVVAETPEVESAAPAVEAPAVETVEEKASLSEPDMQAMFDAGCHFGHQVSKWHPKMAPYIYGSEGGVHLFDLTKTAEQLNKAGEIFYNLAKEGKKLLIVGTKRSAREIIKDAAGKMGCYYISSRWMGGLLTNFEQLQKSIKRMTDIEIGLENGKFDKYTKYERTKLDKERGKLERFFVGLKGITGKPDCIFVVDPQKEKITVQEANREEVNLIALADSNADPREIDLVIPANDDSAKSVQYIVDHLVNAYNAGKAARK